MESAILAKLMSLRFKPKRIVVVLFFIFLFLVSTTASYFYFILSRVIVTEPVPPVPEQSTESFDLSLLPTPSPGIYNIVLLGYGGVDHSGGKLTDTIMVVNLDSQNRQIVLISIPRDLWIALSEEREVNAGKKINNAYAMGGGELAKRAVGVVVGFPIQYFVAVSFEGFREAIDILGGVEVDVPVAFDDYYFPVEGLENETCGKSPEEVEEILTKLSGFEIDKQFPCRFEHVRFDKGKQLMDGETALYFVRSRHSAQHGGDFARSERQQALLLGIKEKLFSLGALDDAIPFFNQLSHTVQTDIDEQIVREIFNVGGDFSQYSILNINLTEANVLKSAVGDGNQFILVPKEGSGQWESVHSFVKDQLEMNRQE